ncbi:hypothetical protein Raf01_71540 [Rugosimonospora africana]|uniref:Uncharacterized protein n=1 Tax=Rugosimonospora africana TaxID=556532 RepID=A0A8J3QZF0_9ACTN|nr:hypothetical protein Raf01_71540 [Rugosimonospora africana]
MSTRREESADNAHAFRPRRVNPARSVPFRSVPFRSVPTSVIHEGVEVAPLHHPLVGKQKRKPSGAPHDRAHGTQGYGLGDRRD